MTTLPRTNRRVIIRLISVLTASVIGAFAVPAVVSAASPEPLDPIASIAGHALLAQPFDVSSVGASHFDELRDEAAELVALRVEVDPAEMRRAWAAADEPHQLALLTGITQLGVPYRRNSSSPGEGFDCSGLTTYAWAGAGVQLTRQSSAQIREAAPRTIDTAQAGDLMQYPGHVMMWLGVDRVVLQAPYSGSTVEVALYKEGRRVSVGDPNG